MVLRDRDLVPAVKKGGGSGRILPALIIGLILAFGVRLIVHAFFLVPIIVESPDMAPGLEPGSRVYVNRLTSPEELRQGDLVLVRHPRTPAYKMVRRVVGRPGDSVQIYDRRLFVNDREVQADWQSKARQAEGPALPQRITRRDNTEKIKIESDNFFLLADDRARALDSRQLGVFAAELIEGKLLD